MPGSSCVWLSGSCSNANAATERRIREAEFPVIKTIDTLDFIVRPSLNENLVHELLRGEDHDRKENVLLVGDPGTGRPHLTIRPRVHHCRRIGQTWGLSGSAR
jgi:DNA replication protein DnaC